MKILQILVEEKEVITGTNCGNCNFAGKSEPCSEDEQNSQGGVIAPDAKHLEMAKESDLVTLPGNQHVTEKIMCTNKKVDQFVTKRMCCYWWDNSQAYREWKHGKD